ncbi:MAG: Potassium efflux system KefA protein / Small-conductance mechanosensitive channel [uncultured Sphingosinicella sp.]|uniref:Potassium efflux system KefA protein / Small-conductance mechanosensitive channel n=1 Tax=uncultured Sphingosinicella sp. TaxID=478748 RepID=A0A6J4TZ63_9SPHN|nr:mechanosensitive ion channel domain-containing protein [uncultured Sphingosinicella sp.]CAA9536237.1 MAG: Potassium efflux system KefA protein / Small-conductance mechanosensitive channel [uncultured Sphingosinicella sp.]
MNGLASRLSTELPDRPELISAGAAIVIIALVWAVSAFVGRKAGVPLARLWERHAGARHEGIADRMCGLVRDGVAAVALAVAIQIEPWPELPEFLLGVALGVAAAMFAFGFIRGLHLPRWAAGLLASVAFVGIVADVADGLTPVTDALDRIGFSIGDTRISLLTVLQAAVTLLLLFAVVKLASRLINHSIHRTKSLDPTQQLLAQKLAGVALLVVAFFMGIEIIGIDLTALAVFSGAFGLAVGFGLQKTFGNLIAGIILLMDRSIKPGDVIVVGDSFGHVTKIGVRAVSVVTRDGKEHLIPNENLMTQEVENWSYSSRDVRMHIPVGVGYDSDLALAQRLMVEAATQSQRVLKNPPPTVWLRAFGESSVDHEILVWITDPEAGVGNVQSEILNRLWVLFKENGIELPFPQRDVRVKEWSANASPNA